MSISSRIIEKPLKEVKYLLKKLWTSDASKIQTLWLFRQIMQAQVRKTADLTTQKKFPWAEPRTLKMNKEVRESFSLEDGIQQ